MDITPLAYARQLRTSLDYLIDQAEKVSALEAENARLQSQSGQGDGSVIPLRLLDGRIYGTAWFTYGGKVLVTAWHVSDGSNEAISELLDLIPGATCFRLKRVGMGGSNFIDGDYADVHLIGLKEDVQAFKASCPNELAFEDEMGLDAVAWNKLPSVPVMVADGFPAGDQQGAPERRYLSPSYRIDALGGLYAFWASLSEEMPYSPGAVLGGFSGGRGATKGGLMGVVVRAALDGTTGREIAVIQPIHNSVVLEEVVLSG